MTSSVKFNEKFFQKLMDSAEVRSLTVAAAQKALATAQANAPVDTGEYKAGLQVKVEKHRDRTVAIVEGTDPKTLLVESKTGNLKKALRAAKI